MDLGKTLDRFLKELLGFRVALGIAVNRCERVDGSQRVGVQIPRVRTQPWQRFLVIRAGFLDPILGVQERGVVVVEVDDHPGIFPVRVGRDLDQLFEQLVRFIKLAEVLEEHRVPHACIERVEIGRPEQRCSDLDRVQDGLSSHLKQPEPLECLTELREQLDPDLRLLFKLRSDGLDRGRKDVCLQGALGDPCEIHTRKILVESADTLIDLFLIELLTLPCQAGVVQQVLTHRHAHLRNIDSRELRRLELDDLLQILRACLSFCLCLACMLRCQVRPVFFLQRPVQAA